MFNVQKKYRSSLGEIKYSSTFTASQLKDRTTGIALKYVFQGTENYIYNQNHITLEKGQLIILPDNQTYEAFAKQSNTAVKGICIDLSLPFIMQEIPILYDQNLLFGLPIQCDSYAKLGQTLNGLSYNVGNQFKGKEDELMFQLRAELTVLVEWMQDLEDRINIKIKKENTQREVLKKLFIAKHFIHEYYWSTIKLDHLSRYVGISKYHFLRLFKLCFKQSPVELQLELRMQRAFELVRADELTLSEIAYQLGYSDLSAFSKQFKQFYLQSPIYFRKH